MPDKITGSGFRPTEPPRRADAKPGSAAELRKPAPQSAGDTVELTQSAQLMSRLEEAVAAAPVVDAGRVKAVKDALAAGTYAVDADAIAGQMIRAEREIR